MTHKYYQLISTRCGHARKKINKLLLLQSLVLMTTYYQTYAVIDCLTNWFGFPRWIMATFALVVGPVVNHKLQDQVIKSTTQCRAVCRNFVKGGGGRTCRILKRGGRSCKQCQGETGRQCGPPQHIKQCSLSCLIRIAIVARRTL